MLGTLSALAQTLSPVTFPYNGTNGTDGSPQTYTVPTGIYALSVVAFGAQGGNTFSSAGGLGGKVDAVLKVTPGQTLTINVGGQPPEGAFGGYNGGGVASKNGGGGGATDIRLNDNALANRTIVAGGGGGGGTGRNIYSVSGNGGGLIGQQGGRDYPNGPGNSGGQGGTQTAGGAAGRGAAENGLPGSLAVGGTGVTFYIPVGSITLIYSSGAGGGGYYGGGSGGNATDSDGVGGFIGGGGGGSSYTNPVNVLRVTHNQGVRSGNGEVIIVPLPEPTLAVSASPNPVCAGSTVALSVTASGSTAPYSYTWTAPAGITLSASSTSAISASVGTGVSGVQTLTITGAASSGFPTSTSLVTLTVNTPPTTVNLAPSGTLTCTKTSVTLTASATGGTSYGFSGPGVVSQNAASGTAVVNASGTYSVTVTDANGCTATQSTSVTSINTSVTATLSNNGPIIDTNPRVTLTADGGITYIFSSGATQQDGPSGNTATVSSPGTYQVTVTSPGGCTATASTLVTGATSQSGCRNGTAVINVVAAGNPVKYEWYRNSITSARLIENPAQVRGTSTSSLTLVNQQVTANYFVRVTDQNGSSMVYGPFKMTVNLNCNVYARVGAEGVELRISMLGNPVQGDQLRAVITGAEGKGLNVQLLDLSGRPIRQQHWDQAGTAQSLTWNLSGQASGAYLLQASTEADDTSQAQRHSLKVIKP